MIIVKVELDEEVAARYYDAAEKTNQDFGNPEPKIKADVLMSLVLARYDMHEICEQADLLLRVAAQLKGEKAFNPVLKDAAA